MTEMKAGKSADYSSYEVREYYIWHMIWITAAACLNSIANIFITNEVIRIIIILCGVTIIIASAIRVYIKAQVKRLELYSDRITINKLNIYATELKEVIVHQSSGYIDFVKKQGFALTKDKRVLPNKQENKTSIHQQLTMFCEQHGIRFTAK